MKNFLILCLVSCLLCNSVIYAQDGAKKDTAGAQSSAAELAKKLANPAASLISVPFQNNTDYGIGTFNGSRNTLNFQPVIPVKLSPKLNMIMRVIVPIVAQKDISGESTSEVGLSDINATLFFTPSESKNGLTLAGGPVFIIPTGTNDFLGTGKFGLGPSFLILKQTSGLTFGVLANQLWSVAGSSSREALSQLFMQPFITHNWKSGGAVGMNAELTQNWESDVFSGFLNATISGVTKLGKQTIQLAVGPRIPVAGPSTSRPDFGFRGVIIWVFPK